MSGCKAHGSRATWWFFVITQIVTFISLGGVSMYSISEFRKNHFRFYICTTVVCVFEALSIATQYENTLVASFLHDLGAFFYILCFTLVLNHWILVQLPLNWDKVRKRIYLGVIVIPNLFSFVSRIVLFFVKLSDSDDTCKAKKSEAVLLAVINLLLIFVIAKIAYRARRILPRSNHHHLRALYEVVGFLTICVFCNVARCVIAFLNAFEIFETESICCTGELVVYNSWLEELIPLILLIKLMWSVDSESNKLILPFVRRSVSNMSTRLLDGREDLMDLLQRTAGDSPMPEDLIPWTTPPSSPKLMTLSNAVSTSSSSCRFEPSSIYESVNACIRVCVETPHVEKNRNGRRYHVVLSWSDDDDDEGISTEGIKFEKSQKQQCFSVVLRVPVFNHDTLCFKLCRYDTNSTTIQDKNTVVGTCTLKWTELVRSVNLCRDFKNSSSNDDVDDDHDHVRRRLCIDLLSVAALPQDVKNMLSPLSTTSLLSTNGIDEEKKDEKDIKLSAKRIVRMFQLSSEKKIKNILVTEVLEEVPYALSTSRILLENLISDLMESLRMCRRELAMSSTTNVIDDDDDDVLTKIPGSESSMQQLLVELHNEAIGETEIERRKEWISKRSEQLSIARACLEACRKLSKENVTFKSSKEKKNSSLRFFPTNLHVQRLIVHNVLEKEEEEEEEKEKDDDDDVATNFMIKTYDRTKQLEILRNSMASRKFHIFRSLEDMIKSSNACYETVTVGAASDHAGKFKDGQGIRQMYAERKQKKSRLNNSTDLDERTGLECEIDSLTMNLDFRCDVVAAQIVPALIAAFVSKLDTTILHHDVTTQKHYLSQLENVGFLLAAESLLSTHGKEGGMIGDYDAAIRSMRRFKFVLRPCDDDENNDMIPPGVQRMEICDAGHESKLQKTPSKQRQKLYIAPRHYFIVLNVKFGKKSTIPEIWKKMWKERKDARPVRVSPVLLSRGINEWQYFAEKFEPKHVQLQTEINTEGYARLTEYCMRYCAWTRNTNEKNKILNQLEHLGKLIAGESTVSILEIYETLSRSLHAGRITSCKSAKDRTAMSVTLEQTRILCDSHGAPSSKKDLICSVMRSHGVRIVNTQKNTGKAKYCFNSIQRSFFPKELRNPEGTGGGGVS